MSFKKTVFIVVASVIVIVVLGGCAAIKIRGGDPGGPIIVIQPTEDPGGGYLTATASTASTDYTGWIDGCLNIPLERADTYTGLPGRLGKEYGADKIVVAKTTGAPFDAKRVVMHYMHYLEARDLTIEVTEDVVPTWTVTTPGATVLKSKWWVPLHNWSGDLYGKIVSVDVTDTSNAVIPIPVAELSKIEIRYNKKNNGNDCE